MFAYNQLVITSLIACMRICAGGKKKTVKLLHSLQWIFYSIEALNKSLVNINRGHLNAIIYSNDHKNYLMKRQHT